MPVIGEKILRGGQEFEYQGYGYWGPVTNAFTITGDVPLPDGAATSENQSDSNQRQLELQSSIENLVKQIRINNLHLSLLTDTTIDKTEID